MQAVSLADTSSPARSNNGWWRRRRHDHDHDIDIDFAATATTGNTIDHGKTKGSGEVTPTAKLALVASYRSPTHCACHQRGDASGGFRAPGCAESRRTNQSAMGGTTTHCSKGERPISIPGSTGISAE